MLSFYLLVLNIVSPSLTLNEHCPIVCTTCILDAITCNNGGLHEIPQLVYQETKKMTLIGHQFVNTYLSRRNFSRFTKPLYSIEQLSIRRSNIHIINLKTFYDLSNLDFLDLSENKQLLVSNLAFDNLKLRLLKLDSIGNLTLKPNSFRGLLVSSLSIKNSHLTSLPYQVFRPLYKDLRKLFLSDNKLTYISVEFESLFRQLEVLHINNNPFICSCPLLWLSRTLSWRLDFYKNDNTPSFQESVQPRCTNPGYLRGRFIYVIPQNDFNCHPPKLDKIEVKFQNPNMARLTCIASVQPKQASLSVSWKKLGGSQSSQSISSIEQNQKSKSSILVNRQNVLDEFLCLAESLSGNASVKININWPNKSNFNRINDNYYSTKTKSGYNYNNNNINNNNNNNKNNNILKPKILPDNIFFKEQFTLLELLGSVLGTFIVTMLVFILIYKFYFYRSVRLKKEQMKKSGYSTYEIGVYSDSQTYDIPHYTTNNDCRTKILHPLYHQHSHPNPHSTSLFSNNNSNKNNFFIDNKK